MFWTPLRNYLFGDPPGDRPVLAKAELDRKLIKLLRFDVPLISADSLRRIDDPLLLDARALKEYEVSHLLMARHVEPDAALPSWLDTVGRDRQIVVYCSVGYRSENFARKLKDAGFQKVSNLYGSIFEWVDRGYAIVDSTGSATQRLHTYNSSWGELVDAPGYTKIW
jgi:Rhodanese-related sulfurtransferase